MQPNDRAEFAQLVTDVHAFYRQDCSQFVLSVWWAACEPFDLEQVRKAMTIHAKDAEAGKFCPKPADIVRVLAGTATDRAMLAWGKAFDAMGRVGAYTDVVFDDAAIHAVIEDLGGWPKVCRTEQKELGYLQHRFCEGYRAYAGRGKFDYPKRLPGDRSPDAEYAKKGLPLPRPAIVGDPDVARDVYEGGGAGKARISFQRLDLPGLGFDGRKAA
jgi:hypothetical protein